MPIPLYGFLKGDTIGLLILAQPEDTVLGLAAKLQQAAEVRVPRAPGCELFYKGKAVDMTLTVAQAGFEPLDRFDVEGREG